MINEIKNDGIPPTFESPFAVNSFSDVVENSAEAIGEEMANQLRNEIGPKNALDFAKQLMAIVPDELKQELLTFAMKKLILSKEAFTVLEIMEGTHSPFLQAIAKSKTGKSAVFMVVIGDNAQELADAAFATMEEMSPESYRVADVKENLSGE